MRFLRHNAVALVAVFIALSGSAYAITSLPANSIGTKQLRDGAVTGKKTAKHTLTGENIRSATLGTVPNADHATNADHAKGAATPMLARITGALGPGDTSFGPVSGFAPADVREDVEQVSPHVPITASMLSVRLSNGALIIGLRTTITLEVNGSDTALSCANSPLHAASCTDYTDTVAIPADSMISFKVANNSVTQDVIVTWIAAS
jgi:hypothetical protein